MPVFRCVVLSFFFRIPTLHTRQITVKLLKIVIVTSGIVMAFLKEKKKCGGVVIKLRHG